MTEAKRQARIHHHMYETCEGIAEHAERIVRLEELVMELYDFYCVDDDELGEAFQEEIVFSENVRDRMRELGIEVDDGAE